MRILHVLHHSLPFLSGYSIRSSYIVNLQRSMSGLTTSVVTSAQHPNAEAAVDHIDGSDYRRTPKRDGGKTPFVREWQLMSDLEKVIEAAVHETAPELIHAHSPVLVGLPALRVARRHRIPMVYEIRDLWENACIDRGKFSATSVSYRIARNAESYVLRRADAVVAICQGLRNELVTRVTDPGKVHVIANGVDVEMFKPAEPDDAVRARWKLAGKQVVLYAGTFQPYEGLDLLVRAMAQVVQRFPQAQLVIVGGSPGLAGGASELTPEERHLQEVVREQNLSAHVTFTGRIPHADVRQMYALADVLAYPRRLTRTTALTTPLKPLEAMAMGKPVIVSDVPAMLELVSDGETGLVFEAGSESDLAAKCSALIRNDFLRRRLGGRARETVVRERQWPHLISKYVPIYDALRKRSMQSKEKDGSHAAAAEDLARCR